MCTIAEKGVCQQKIQIDELAGVERCVLRLLGAYRHQHGLNGCYVIVRRPESLTSSVAEHIDKHVYLRSWARFAAPSRFVCSTRIELGQQHRGTQRGAAHGELRRRAGSLNAHAQVLTHLLEYSMGRRRV
jgi:hypothetical protein